MRTSSSTTSTGASGIACEADLSACMKRHRIQVPLLLPEQDLRSCAARCCRAYARAQERSNSSTLGAGANQVVVGVFVPPAPQPGQSVRRPRACAQCCPAAATRAGAAHSSPRVRQRQSSRGIICKCTRPSPVPTKCCRTAETCAGGRPLSSKRPHATCTSCTPDPNSPASVAPKEAPESLRGALVTAVTKRCVCWAACLASSSVSSDSSVDTSP